MMTLERGSFSSFRLVRHAMESCSVVWRVALDWYISTHLRHYFYNLSMEILCRSGPFCACRHHTRKYQHIASLIKLTEVRWCEEHTARCVANEPVSVDIAALLCVSPMNSGEIWPREMGIVAAHRGCLSCVLDETRCRRPPNNGTRCPALPSQVESVVSQSGQSDVFLAIASKHGQTKNKVYSQNSSPWSIRRCALDTADFRPLYLDATTLRTGNRSLSRRMLSDSAHASAGNIIKAHCTSGGHIAHIAFD
jgi:hypothetical protein